MSNLNWDHLRRNQLFNTGKLTIPEEWELEGEKGPKKLRQFRDLPSIIPVRVKSKVEVKKPQLEKAEGMDDPA